MPTTVVFGTKKGIEPVFNTLCEDANKARKNAQFNFPEGQAEGVAEHRIIEVDTDSSRYETLFKRTYQQVNIAIYCVDLSNFNQDKIDQDIALFRKYNEKAEIVVVGLNLGKTNEETAISIPLTAAQGPHQKINELSELNDFKKELEAKISREGWQVVENVEKKVSNREPQVSLEWRTAKISLLNNLIVNNISKEKKNKIEIALSTFENSISTFAGNSKQIDEAFKAFTTECSQTLEGKYPNVWKSVVVCVVSAAVLAGAAIAGYFLGLAAGSWSGFGAFITGFAGASWAAAAAVPVAAVASAAVVGGLTGYGLFKDSKEMTAVKSFAQEAKGSLEKDSDNSMSVVEPSDSSSKLPRSH